MDDNKPRGSQAGLAAFAQVARATLEGSARQKHGPAAEASHLAALAVERLTSELARLGLQLTLELEATVAMRREAQNSAHLAYLRAHGSEEDYQQIGRKVTAKYRTPSGRWRKMDRT